MVRDPEKAGLYNKLASCIVATSVAVGSSLTNGCISYSLKSSVIPSQISKEYRIQKLEKRICVLPTEVNTGQESYRDIVADSLARYLKKERNLELISASDFTNMINSDKELESAWRRMMEIYRKENRLPKEILNVFKEKLGIEYFVVSSLLNFKQRDSTRLGILGFRTIITNIAEDSVAVQIWDTETGLKVWGESVEYGHAKETLFIERPIPLEDVLNSSWKKLSKDLPSKNEKEESQ